MYTIKFETVMDFGKDHNRWAYGELLKAVKGDGGIVPFVGAGLSVPFGVKQWATVLKDAVKSVRNPAKQAEIQKMIDEQKYIDAAQEILNSYKFFLRQLPQKLGTPDLSNEKLYPSAVYLLPWLFPGQPVITTNFDSVLETVYGRCSHSFPEILQPNSIAQLTQVRQNNIHALVKLHGTIGETVDINALVFTKEQYQNAYDPNGALVKELQNWYSNRHLLFLGCSLEADETLRVLRSLIESGAYPTHFTILGCKEDEIDARTDQLADLGIIPIFYDINNHDAVPVILERLLEDTNQPAYQKLIREKSAMMPIPSQNNNLLYDAEYVDFVGRTEELKKLSQFCDSQTTNAWWAVTGAGGMGKSRLVLEFTKQMKKKGWRCQWFRREEFTRLQNWQPPTEPVIVVLDEVQSNADAAAGWLSNAGQNARSNKLRVILLERDGECYDNADWTRSIRIGDRYNDPLRRWCYQETFLRLSSMDEKDLKEIMLEYAQKAQKTVAVDALLDTLRSVDPGLMRPLYAMAIVEAACNGEDPTNWDSEKILEVMLDRELRFHYQCMSRILKEEPTQTQSRALERLIVQLCVRGQMPLEDVTEADYPYLMSCASQRNMDREEFFRGLGLLRGRNALRLDCPDLVKEYLVLKLVFDSGNWDQLLVGDWENDTKMWTYLDDRLLLNHTRRMEREESFLRCIMDAKPTQEMGASGFAGLLWDITVHIPPLIEKAVNCLEQLHRDFPAQQWILHAFSAGLYNLTVGSGLDVRLNAVDRLEILRKDHNDDQTVAEDCAKALFNLSVEQDLAGRQETVGKLEELCKQYPDNQSMAVEYAKALVNLSNKQDLAGRQEKIKKLEELCKQHPDNQDVAEPYAKALFNLTNKQDLHACQDTVGKLEELCKQHPDNQSMAVEYAKALVNLSVEQDLAGCQETVGKLEELCKQYPDDQDVAEPYAMSMFNLTLQQEETDIPATLESIAEVLRQKQSVKEAFIEALKEYLQEHPEHERRYASLLSQ